MITYGTNIPWAALHKKPLNEIVEHTNQALAALPSGSGKAVAVQAYVWTYSANAETEKKMVQAALTCDATQVILLVKPYVYKKGGEYYQKAYYLKPEDWRAQEVNYWLQKIAAMLKESKCRNLTLLCHEWAQNRSIEDSLPGFREALPALQNLRFIAYPSRRQPEQPEICCGISDGHQFRASDLIAGVSWPTVVELYQEPLATYMEYWLPYDAQKLVPVAGWCARFGNSLRILEYGHTPGVADVRCYSGCAENLAMLSLVLRPDTIIVWQPENGDQVDLLAYRSAIKTCQDAAEISDAELIRRWNG